MTVHVETSRVQYIGDNSQTVFAFNFRIFADSNLFVYVDDVLQAQVTDYSNTNNGDETGGEVTFVVAPIQDAVITIYRLLPNHQLLDLIEFDRFPAESMESAMDYLMYCIQQNTTEISKAARFSDLIPEGFDFILPLPGAGS